MTDDYVAKVRLLEENLGHRVSYRLLDPFHVDPSNAVDVQAATRRIAEFAGVGQYRFIVGLCRQEQGVGGRIELHPLGDDVFIEVANELRESTATVLATLAHEITHKYLQVNRVSCGFGLEHHHENEILTDIASLWLGLGKLTLNGCDTESRTVERTFEGTRTTTTSHRAGYLKPREFSFVYLLICTMRGIPAAEYERDLTARALQALYKARERYREYLNPTLRLATTAVEIGSRLGRAVNDSQSACARVSRDVALLRKSCLDIADSFLLKSHVGFKSRLEEFAREAATEHVNPCLQFLHNLELDRLAAVWEREMGGVTSQAATWSTSLDAMLIHVRDVGRPFLAFSGEMVATFTCPQDGTVLRVDTAMQRVRVRCRACRYEWTVETTLPDPAASAQQKGRVPVGQRSWLRRIAKVLSRRA